MKFPGTTINTERIDPQTARALLDGAFASGGLVLSQVTALTGLELYTVQNWVKRGFVAPPVGKKYSRRQLCRLVTINMLKDSMAIGDITFMLSYINGVLDDESDDTVSDDTLYLYFIAMLAAVEGADSDEVRAAAEAATADYTETAAGARERIISVLEIMYYAYRSAQYSKSAAGILARCKGNE